MLKVVKYVTVQSNFLTTYNSHLAGSTPPLLNLQARWQNQVFRPFLKARIVYDNQSSGGTISAWNGCVVRILDWMLLCSFSLPILQGSLVFQGILRDKTAKRYLEFHWKKTKSELTKCKSPFQGFKCFKTQFFLCCYCWLIALFNVIHSLLYEQVTDSVAVGINLGIWWVKLLEFALNQTPTGEVLLR